MNLPKRKNVRLKDYDYSQNGVYFLTVCVENRNELLSEIRRGDPCGRPNVRLTKTGKIAKEAFTIIENSFNIIIDKYVIMPNHIHFILIKNDLIEERVAARVAPTATVGRIVGAYKFLLRMNG